MGKDKTGKRGAATESSVGHLLHRAAQRLLRAHIEQSKLEVRHITLDMLYQARQRIAASLG